MAYQPTDVPLAIPLDLGDLLLVLLVLHPQVTSLHLVGLDHVAEGLVSLLLRGLQLSNLLQELHSLLVKETPCLLFGLQGECCAHLSKWRWRRKKKLLFGLQDFPYLQDFYEVIDKFTMTSLLLWILSNIVHHSGDLSQVFDSVGQAVQQSSLW